MRKYLIVFVGYYHVLWGNSFAVRALVLMIDSSVKPVGDFKVGDKVENVDSGVRQQHAITAVHVTDTDFVDLAFGPAGSPKTVTVTAHHLFWDATTHQWTDAADLRIGDQLDTPGDGHVAVVSAHRYTTSIRTYNLTIDTVHTYYVAAGSTRVLVHNEDECGPALSGVGDKQFGKKWGKHSKDYGLNPGDPDARAWFENRIYEVRGGYDKVRQGEWNPDNGGGTGYWFYRKDDDLLVTKGDGSFVTMFPLGGRGNGWWDKAGVR